MTESAPNTSAAPEPQHIRDPGFIYDEEIDSFLDFSPPTPEELAVQRDMEFRSFYLDPAEIALIREADGMPPITQDEFEEWVSTADPEVIAGLNQERAALQAGATHAQEVADRLHLEVPELYDARLPQALESRLGGVKYALGFNQTGVVSAIEDANEYLAEAGGIDVTGYNYHHRFMIFDQDMTDYVGPNASFGIARPIEIGYYGTAAVGRFVAAFPEAHPERSVGRGSLANRINSSNDLLPDDFELPHIEEGGDSEGEIVNPKYLAGFIDGTGAFWANGNFMVSSEPALQKYQAETAEHVDNNLTV